MTNQIQVNAYDLAISLFWSQHRPLALFHQLQNKEAMSVHSSLEPSFDCTGNMQHISHWLQTPKKIQPIKSSDKLLLLQPFEYFKNKYLPLSHSLNTSFFISPFHNFYIKKEATSVKRKRRLKMNKHKFKKRRDKQRALRKRLGK